MVDHILYINLDQRTDRRESTENLLSGFSYERIPAIKHEIGGIGTSMSHIKALQYAIAKGWNHVLIMEDDMQWNNFEENYEKLKKFMKKPYDVIVLAGMLVSHDPETSKLYKSNCAGAYLVSRHYYTKLLGNFQKGLQLLLTKSYSIFTASNSIKSNYNIDIYWHRLQASDNWFIIPLCYCIEGYSDCDNKITNWKQFFLT